MNKKLVASLSAIIMASSFFTVTAAPKKVPTKKVVINKVKTKATKSAEVQALEAQIKANTQATQDLIAKVMESDEYKQLLIKNLELQKSIIDQQLKEGSISANQATAKKAQLDAQAKMIQDTALKPLETEFNTIKAQIKTLQTKYPKLADLIATQDFKDLKAKLITNIKAIIDRYVADGAMTSDEATKVKANIDTLSTNIDAGKSNIAYLLQIFNGSGKAFGGHGAK